MGETYSVLQVCFLNRKHFLFFNKMGAKRTYDANKNVVLRKLQSFAMCQVQNHIITICQIGENECVTQKKPGNPQFFPPDSALSDV